MARPRRARAARVLRLTTSASARWPPASDLGTRRDHGTVPDQDEQDSAIYLTAALSGLPHGELLALRWSDVDFANAAIRVDESYAQSRTGTPKSRESRTVPTVDKVADTVSSLKERGHHTRKTSLLFVSRDGTRVESSALRRR